MVGELSFIRCDTEGRGGGEGGVLPVSNSTTILVSPTYIINNAKTG